MNIAIYGINEQSFKVYEYLKSEPALKEIIFYTS